MSFKSKLINIISPINDDLSEGELYIKNFFKENKIKFQTQYEINGLKGDLKGDLSSYNFRRADFYLPKFKTYVEFNGKWNVSESHKSRYREKKKVYEQNNIPCIYFYPENLGIIEHTFNYRMKEVLKKYKMKNELFKFRIHLFMKDRSNLFLYFIMSILLITIFKYDFNVLSDLLWFIAFLTIPLFQLYRFVTGYFKFFIND